MKFSGVSMTVRTKSVQTVSVKLHTVLENKFKTLNLFPARHLLVWELTLLLLPLLYDVIYECLASVSIRAQKTTMSNSLAGVLDLLRPSKSTMYLTVCHCLCPLWKEAGFIHLMCLREAVRGSPLNESIKRRNQIESSLAWQPTSSSTFPSKTPRWWGCVDRMEGLSDSFICADLEIELLRYLLDHGNSRPLSKAPTVSCLACTPCKASVLETKRHQIEHTMSNLR